MVKEEKRIYLSNVIETEKFKKGQANVIIAPCHSGKTTAAVTKIAPLASHIEKVLFLIDTTAGRDSLAKEKEFQKFSKRWLKELKVAEDWWGSLLAGDGIRVMTYHHFGYQVAEDPDFLKSIDIIICDEMHNLIKYLGIESKQKSMGTPCKTALNEIIRVSKLKENAPLVVIMSATINSVSLALNDRNVKIESFDYYGKVDEDKTLNIKYYSNLETVINNLEIGKKVIIYLSQIKMMRKFAEIAENNWHNTFCLWGSNNEENKLNDEQKNVREYILQNQRIPDNIDILFINSAYETSINIKDDRFKTMIIHTKNYEEIIQVRGRLRHDINTLYIYDSKHIHIKEYFPDEYCSIPLYREKQKEIVEKLNLRNEKGSVINWRGIVKLLQADGVRVNYCSNGKRRYCVVHKKV